MMIPNTTTRRSFVLVCMMLASFAWLSFADTRGRAAAALDEAQKTKRALQFITQHGTAMITIIANDSLSKKEKRLKLKAILEENLDLTTMARAIVGPYWREMTEEQRERYRSASERWIVLYSANLLSTVKPSKFEVLSANPLGKDVLVKTETQSKRSSEPFSIDWRVRFKADEAILLDMHFRGLSMVAAQRSEASALLAEQGIPVFLDKLDERLKKITQEFNKN